MNKPTNVELHDLRRQIKSLEGALGFIEQLIEIIPCPVFYKDADGRYLGCNQPYADISGKKRADLIGKTAHDIWPKETADKIRAVDEELLKKTGVHETQDYESARDSATGTVRTFLVHKTTFLKSGDSVGSILGVMWDVTDRKLAEQRLQDKLQFIEQLIEAIPNPVYYKDVSGHYMGCNRRYEEFVGKKREELIGKTVDQILPPDIAERIRLADEALLRNLGAQEQEYEEKDASDHGAGRELMVRRSTFCSSDGRAAGILGVIWDVTEKNRTERAFKRQLSLIEHLIESIPSPVVYKDENQRYLGCNRAYEEFTGKKRAELVGKLPRDVWPKNLADRYDSADEVLRREPRVHEYEAPLTAADGTLHTMMFRRAAIFKEDGSFGGHVSVAFDLTDEKRIEKYLRNQVMHDPLTGLYNRRYLDDVLRREFARATRSRASIGIIMSDVDHFKRINDTFGHDIGDEVLRRVARALKSHVRLGDVVCRYGGEEFIVILPGATLDQARGRAEYIRVSIEQLAVVREKIAIGPITMSFGVAAFPDHGKTPASVIGAADGALMRAKESGRNRVCAAH